VTIQVSSIDLIKTWILYQVLPSTGIIIVVRWEF
jgi:hypothetical protein